VLPPQVPSKRCRQARPLTWMGRLAARERPGTMMLINAETLVALGAESFPIQVKGGIARTCGEELP